MINGYDSWKLSNPWDDGDESEQEIDRINETVFFKYMNGKKYSYGMINTEGSEIRVHHYMTIPTIEMDEIEPTNEDLYDELYRVKMNYTQFEHISQEEFMEQFKMAQSALTKIISNEADD